MQSSLIQPKPVSRIQCALVAMAGCIPFSNPHRFPPISGFWGQWAAVVLFVAWLLASAWKRERNNEKFKPIPLTALALVALGLLTALQAALGIALFRSGALVASGELILAGLVCIEAACARQRGEHVALLECFAWGALVALGLNALSMGSARVDLGIKEPFSYLIAFPQGGRDVGLIGHSNHLGVLAVLAWASAMFLSNRGRLRVGGYLAITALAALVCAATSSRIALVLAILLSFVSLTMRRSGRRLGPSISWDSDRRVVWAAVVTFVAVQVGWRLWSSAQGDPMTSVMRGGGGGRLEMIRDGLLLGWQHPILGVGFGNYAGARLFDLQGSFPSSNADNAHNLLAQAWAEWGVVGGLIVVAGVAALLSAVWRNVRGDRGSAEWLFSCFWVLALLTYSLVEHPLWFAHFLFPFAWLLGTIPQPEIHTQDSAQPASRTLVVFGAVVAAAVLLAVGVDYRRSERLATQVLVEIQRDPNSTAHVSKVEAMGIANLTLFPASAELMQSRALDLDPLLADVKLAMAEKSVRALPHPETMARYIAFLIFNGRQPEADAFLGMLRRRERSLAAETEQMLGEISSSSPLIAAFLAAMASGSASDQNPHTMPSQ